MNKKSTLLLLVLLLSIVARSQVIISQYYEGAGVNKWIEITNVGGTSINLASPQLKLGLWAVSGSAGNITFSGAPTNIMLLTGVMAPGQTFLIGNSGNQTELPYLTAASANQTDNSVINFNGNDGIALLDASNVIIDQFGLGISAIDISYVRNVAITSPNTTYTGSEWNQVARTTVQTAGVSDPNRLGYHIASTVAACSEPATQPTNLNLVSTPSTVNGSFTNSTPDAEEYLVVRSTASTLSANPVDGTTYTAGNTLGGGVVIQYDAINTFSESGLVPSTTYYYFIFAANSQNCSGGPNYLNTGALTGSISTQAMPACVAPPSAPTNLILSPSASSISGAFTAAAGANRYLIVRSSTNSLSASPANGITYSTGQSFGGGTVVAYTVNTNFAAGGLNPLTTYYFFVFAASGECTGEPFYNTTSLNGTATTTNGFNDAAYYSSATGNCQTLKTNLKNIISANTAVLSYTPGLWNAFLYTDQHRNDANTATIIWDMYSDNPTGPEPYTYTFGTNQCGNYNSEADCYNREHSFPQSWFDSDAPMVSDLHHIFATDGKVNGQRGNLPYGEVINPDWTSLNGSKRGTGNNFGYTGTVFEPINAYKGDFARAQLYMAVRYEDQLSGWWSNGTANDALLSPTDEPNAAIRKLQVYDNWYIQLLNKWHQQDPPSQKEIDRNNAIYDTLVNDGGLKRQGNRNPFVDHPEYVNLVWQCVTVIPVTITSFTAVKNVDNILLQWQATRETNFKQYLVERGTDGVNFSVIGNIAGQNLANYSFTDTKLPNGTIVYYRLKMVDVDGSFKYSKVVSVRINKYANAIVYPNPAKDIITIKLEKALSANGNLIITDVTGQIMQRANTPAGTNIFNAHVKQLPTGRYFIKIVASNEVINHSFLISR